MIPWQLRDSTRNKKLGHHTAVITIGAQSCPVSCPLRTAGCYAASGPMAINWRHITNEKRHSGTGFHELANAILDWTRNNKGRLIRIGDAGQITDTDGKLSNIVLSALSYLDIRRNKAIVYVHPTEQTDMSIVGLMASLGVAINISRHGTSVRYLPDIPQVTTVPRGTFSAGRRKVGDILQCPEEYREDITCDSCRLCALPRRRCVVGFTSHGAKAKVVDGLSV